MEQTRAYFEINLLLYEDYNREAIWHLRLPISASQIMPGVTALKQKTDSVYGISFTVIR